jgi:hypothetical protein
MQEHGDYLTNEIVVQFRPIDDICKVNWTRSSLLDISGDNRIGRLTVTTDEWVSNIPNITLDQAEVINNTIAIYYYRFRKKDKLMPTFRLTVRTEITGQGESVVKDRIIDIVIDTIVGEIKTELHNCYPQLSEQLLDLLENICNICVKKMHVNTNT